MSQETQKVQEKVQRIQELEERQQNPKELRRRKEDFEPEEELLFDDEDTETEYPDSALIYEEDAAYEQTLQEKHEEIDYEHEYEEDYFPMFWSSAQAALLTIFLQFFVPIFLALQMAVGSEIRLWKRFLPYFALNTDLETFILLVKWSSIVTACGLAGFSLLAFVFRRRLQVQAGRAFAWLDIALIGGLQLSRSYWFDRNVPPSTWMWAMLIVGCVGFCVAFVVIWIDYADRENTRKEDKINETVSSSHIVRTA